MIVCLLILLIHLVILYIVKNILSDQAHVRCGNVYHLLWTVYSEPSLQCTPRGLKKVRYNDGTLYPSGIDSMIGKDVE